MSCIGHWILVLGSIPQLISSRLQDGSELGACRSVSISYGEIVVRVEVLDDGGGATMRLKETFSQEDIRTILPSKIALVADLFSKRSGEDPVKVMSDFYKSKTYAMLQDESTKYWWFGPAELCELFERENDQDNPR